MTSGEAPDLGFLVTSDLHLGERNGVLTDPDADGRLVANGAMDALAEGLRGLAEDLGGTRPPTLVFNGDCLELALARRHVAIDVFDQFVTRLLPPGNPFAADIGWIPGNHDHTVWPSAREALDVRLLETGGPAGPLPSSPAATAMFAGLGHDPDVDAPPAAESPLLTGVLRSRHPHLLGGVHVVYPNLALVSGDRVLVLHHGHLADRFCTLMTPIAERLSGGVRDGGLPADLEADNGAWINFLWSSLGQEGRSGATLKRIYDLMQTETSRVVLGNGVARGVVGEDPGPVGRLAGAAIRRGVVLAVMAAMGVGNARLVEDPRPQDDRRLLAYLAGPVAAQLHLEHDLRDLGEVRRFGFVFGHTHQPFCDTISGDGVTVDAINTGGWVVDTDEPRPRVGCAVALVSTDLDLALVRIAQQHEDPSRSVLHVQAPHGSSPAFAESVRAAILERADVWRTLQRELAAAVCRRRRELAEDLARERAELHASGLRVTAFERQVAEAQRWAARALARRKAPVSVDVPRGHTDLPVFGPDGHVVG